MKKELLVIGAGNIGRGVIGGLFFESGYHLYIYDIMAERMEKLKEQGSYLVERIGADQKRRIVVDDFEVLDCSTTEDLIEHMKTVDLIACCVYEGAFSSICENLKEAIEYRAKNDAEPLNILLCVNALGAPDYFETKLTKLLKDNEQAGKYLKEKTGICQVMVGMAAMPSSDELMAEDAFAVTTKLDGHIGIDEEPFKGKLPDVKQTGGVAKGKAQIYRKVYTGNMKHCMLAFLGNAKGYEFIRDTYDDPWIEECAFGAFYEADAAIQKEYEFDEKDHQEWIDFIVKAPKNRNLKDAFTRVAANPKTKLSRDNRFVGPAILCMKHHILPYYLSKGIAYGFLYRNEADADSVEITDFVKEHGIEKALEVYCGLKEEWELKQLITAQYKEALKLR
jgi:mannitol-1-phosphate 5-dehydrogenase